MPQETVVILDDSQKDFEKLAAELRSRFDVLRVATGPELIARLEENPAVDCLILDVILERQTLQGLDVLARIRAKTEYDHISTIVITHKPESRHASEVLRHGADDYMDKDQSKDLMSRVIISIAKARVRQLRRLILAALHRSQVLSRALHILDTLHEPDVAALMLMISEQDEVQVVNETNLPSGESLGQLKDFELFERVSRSGRFLFIEGPESARLHPQKLAARALLAVPVFSEIRKCIGLICFFSSDPTRLDPEWVGPLTELADLIAIGLDICSKAETLASERARAAAEAERQSWAHVPVLLGELRHRIATPCNVMLNHIQSLVSKDFQDPEINRLRPELRSEISRRLNTVRRNADNVRRECEYITTVMQTRPLDKTQFDLVGLLDDCLAEIQPELESNYIEGTFDRGGHVGINIVADEKQLAYAVQCLLKNGLEAILEKRRQSLDPAPHVSSSDQIAITLNPDGHSEVLFAIADTGIGVPPENRKKLFQPLFTTKQRQQPGGFGLFSVKSILRAHGGNIQLIRSDKERGSVFELSLPLESHEPFS
jgi:signal transduction histidine kinase/FixJ family two-component response regulator